MVPNDMQDKLAAFDRVAQQFAFPIRIGQVFIAFVVILAAYAMIRAVVFDANVSLVPIFGSGGFAATVNGLIYKAYNDTLTMILAK